MMCTVACMKAGQKTQYGPCQDHEACMTHEQGPIRGVPPASHEHTYLHCGATVRRLIEEACAEPRYAFEAIQRLIKGD